jgi:DNA invertase Pin-like site-specific DNA recombinase
MKRAVFYALVSATGETIENQLRDLQAVASRFGWQVVDSFIDQSLATGKGKKEQPVLGRLLNAVIRGEVDVVAAWSVGGLAKSLQELLTVLSVLHERNVDLYLHQQDLDTATASGKALYQTLEVLAELERAITTERTLAGMAQAKAEGRRLGHPPISASLIEDIQALRAEGHSQRVIAGMLGVGKGTVQKYTMRSVLRASTEK